MRVALGHKFIPLKHLLQTLRILRRGYAVSPPMKKIVTLGLALFASLALQMAHASWNADWTKRVRINLNTTADGLPLNGAVDAMPVLVRLHTGNFPFVDAKPDGSDLRFVAADDKTPLKFHIEKFDGLNELALVWVQYPKLASNSKSDYIWLYYGNEKAAPGSEPKGTYDPAQVLVYHFGEKDGPPQDASAAGNHAAASTAKPSASALIGGGASFDGSGQIEIKAAPTLKLGPGGLTVSMWLKPTELADATLLSIGGSALTLHLEGGKLVATAGAVKAASTAALSAGAWQHVALIVKDGLTLYVGGQEAGKTTGAVPAIDGPWIVGKGYKGELDELEAASVARSADWIKAAALSQGQEQKLVGYGQAEGGDDSGPSYVKILLGAVTPDGWIVICLLMVMFAVSIFVMVSKAAFVNTTGRANQKFKAQFRKLIDSVSHDEDAAALEAAEAEHRKAYARSSLYRLYASGLHELRGRFQAFAKAGREPLLSDQSINAIRATIDATLVRETQRLNSKMVLLTIAIAGGPFLGLLGTVVGVMITFAAIAAAGDVNVNSIAPGIAAALVATVAGLAVAIPSLFGYNYLASRIKDLNSDMQVFVDEFITKIAENHSV